MTTPHEFLQFAKEMGLGSIHSTSSSSPSPSRSIPNTDEYTTTGLAVLNNLCRLIEQIHQLRAENHHLRAHLELVDHIEKFQQRFRDKDHFENEKSKEPFATVSIYDGDKSVTLSPLNSFKSKRAPSYRDQKGVVSGPNHDDVSAAFSHDHESPESFENNSKDSTSVPTWNRVRHALKFSLRRKPDSPTSPPLAHIERQIPTISISIESDDDQLQDQKCLKKKKKPLITKNNNRPITVGEDTDQDDEFNPSARACHRVRLDANETTNSSSIDRQDTASSINISFNTSNADDEQLLKRKQSKIARYRRKLRSKLDNVKKQFSDQHFSSSTSRLFHQSQGSTFDSVGSGFNHAVLAAQLAPAMTKSYQQKMRDWEIMQKSQFLVNYRRQSVAPKIDFINSSKKNSLSQATNDHSTNPIDSTLVMDNPLSIIDTLDLEFNTNLLTLTPILSPKQRSFIVHQWREIMSEEISIRYYNKYLKNKMILLKELESNLKDLKTSIFCTKELLKQQSMINLSENDHPKHSYLAQRCRSLESFICTPASWILAVQSTAYSDILDGTSKKTTERAILFNKDFFDRLEQFKVDRFKFEHDSIEDLHLLTQLKTKFQSIEKPKDHTNLKLGPFRGRLRKLSLISSNEIPQQFHPDPGIPLQIFISHLSPSIKSERFSSTNSTNDLSASSNTLPKSSKHSRFDLKKSFQRSRSAYITQFHSWLQRRRQHHSSSKRRKSAAEPKVAIRCSTPTLLGSPRLARLHQRLFKTSAPSSPQTLRTPISVELLDDSDNRSQYEAPVRIYFPPLTPLTPPTHRHVRIAEITPDVQIISASNITTPLSIRKYTSSSSFRMTTAKERRESFATLSNIFNNRCV